VIRLATQRISKWRRQFEGWGFRWFGGQEWSARASSSRGSSSMGVPVAAAAEVNHTMTKGPKMSRKNTNSVVADSQTVLLMLVLSCALAVLPYAAFSSRSRVDGNLPSTQKTFATPKEAANALIASAENFNLPALQEILGPDGEDLVSSEDPVQDKNKAAAFAAMAREKTDIILDSSNPKRATLSVGNEDWPLAIPIVKTSKGWLFDTKAGREEILFRRIGANELDAIQICRGYVEAQYEYATQKHDNSEVNQYAEHIISTPGKHDGLAWRNPDGTLGGPVGEGVAKALEQGYTNRSQPYHGYYFKILKGQGPAAPLGQMDFMVNGAMIGGFALAAAPADYRVTGVKTFSVSYEGIVYEKDLGPNTLEIFKSMELYNPDKTWRRTDDHW
jgi:Protein of unknown function (DUF2950)